MTKLCPRGKAAAKRKFKVYPSAYANAYASKICAGKIKDPSGTKRKDWGPKKMNKGGGADTGTVGEIRSKQGVIFNKVKRMVRDDKDLSPKRRKRILRQVKAKSEERMNRKNIEAGIEFSKELQRGRRELFKSTAGKKIPAFKVGMAVDAGSRSGLGRLEKSGFAKDLKAAKDFVSAERRDKAKVKKMMSGGFGIFGKKKKEEEKKSVQEENATKKKKRLEELRKEIGAKKGKMMIMIAIGKPKKASKGSPPKGVVKPGMKSPKKKAIPGDPRERHEYIRKIQNPISEYDKKGKLKYTAANKGKIMQVASKLEKASKAHAGQAKTLRSIKVRGGGMAVQGMNFKGVY